MIEFLQYETKSEAPVIFVNGVGGIYKIGANSLQVVFITRLKNADGEWMSKGVISLIWDEKAWLDAGRLFRFAMEQWQHGSREDGIGRKRLVDGTH